MSSFLSPSFDAISAVLLVGVLVVGLMAIGVLLLAGIYYRLGRLARS